MPFSRRYIGLVAFSIAVFVLPFLFLELVVRIAQPHVSSLEIFAPPQNFGGQTRHLWGGQIFEGDALLGWRLIPNLKNTFWDFTTFSTNRQHFRYPTDIENKNPGTIRILMLGDSVTFGYRVPVTFPENPSIYDKSQEPYPALLEKYLREHNPDKKIEVIPMAVPGYTTYQGLAWLKRDIARLKPDLITIMYGWNDQELHVQADKQALPTGTFHILARKIMIHSQALIYASRWWAHLGKEDAMVPPLEQNTPRVSKDDYLANILAMVDVAKNNNARAVIIGPVYEDLQSNAGQGKNIMEYRSALKQTAGQAGIPYLEIPALTEQGFPANQTLFQEPIHPNATGHQIIAETLEKFFNQSGIFSSLHLQN